MASENYIVPHLHLSRGNVYIYVGKKISSWDRYIANYETNKTKNSLNNNTWKYVYEFI